MIRYALICDKGHEFEAWFSSSSDYDRQSADGLITCPFCSSPHVTKAIMAPAVSTSRQQEKNLKEHARAMALMNKAAAKVRETIAAECDYVGEHFADEARAMHYGEKDERAIYGETSPQEALSLREEGIPVSPLPDVLTPKPKKTLN